MKIINKRPLTNNQDNNIKKMKAQTFNINMVILGHVSVGKTTLLNALLGEKFGEVSMKRTTAGVHHFLLSSDNEKDRRGNIKQRDANEILNCIRDDNMNLRKKMELKESTFNVNMEDPIIQMRPDTNLIITDVPGVNEAGTSEMYLKFVEERWDSFDIVVVVMDATQGVNTEDQVKLLKFVQKNNSTVKDLFTIVVCNKVDHPDVECVSELVDEVRSEVEKIFCVKDRKKSLALILEGKKNLVDANPVFIPLSAETAFLYRAASRLNQEEFQKRLGKDSIDKLGREEVGAFKWRRLSPQDRYKVVYDAVSDPLLYKERLASSNFDSFLKLLDVMVAGEENQIVFLEKQLLVKTKKISAKKGFVDDLTKIYEINTGLGKCSKYLRTKFWELFHELEKEALDLYEKDPKDMIKLSDVMEELEKFVLQLLPKIVIGIEPKDSGIQKVIFNGCKFIKNSFEVIIKHLIDHKEKFRLQQAHRQRYGHHHSQTTQTKNPWDEFSPKNWSYIISSILLMKFDNNFCKKLSKSIVEFEWQQANIATMSCFSCQQQGLQCKCTCLACDYEDLSSPNHWGHIAWTFCNIMKKLELSE